MALDLSPALVRSPAPGARRQPARPPALRRSLLDDADQRVLGRSLGRRGRGRSSDRRRVWTPRSCSSWASRRREEPGLQELVARGFHRLNRDERGGSFRDSRTPWTAAVMRVSRVVLGPTYVYAARPAAVSSRPLHGALPEPLHLAGHAARAGAGHLVERMLDRLGSLPRPDALKELAGARPA